VPVPSDCRLPIADYPYSLFAIRSSDCLTYPRPLHLPHTSRTASPKRDHDEWLAGRDRVGGESFPPRWIGDRDPDGRRIDRSGGRLFRPPMPAPADSGKGGQAGSGLGQRPDLVSRTLPKTPIAGEAPSLTDCGLPAPGKEPRPAAARPTQQKPSGSRRRHRRARRFSTLDSQRARLYLLGHAIT
jgi:hypothetical protein